MRMRSDQKVEMAVDRLESGTHSSSGAVRTCREVAEGAGVHFM